MTSAPAKGAPFRHSRSRGVALGNLRRPSADARVSVLLKPFFAPRTIVPQEGVCDQEQLGGNGNFWGSSSISVLKKAPRWATSVRAKVLSRHDRTSRA